MAYTFNELYRQRMEEDYHCIAQRLVNVSKSSTMRIGIACHTEAKRLLYGKVTDSIPFVLVCFERPCDLRDEMVAIRDQENALERGEFVTVHVPCLAPSRMLRLASKVKYEQGGRGDQLTSGA